MATKAKAVAEQPIVVIRRVKKVSGGGHHGGAWKVAYADFVTAMMAFFMLLWLLSNPDKQRLKGLAEYFSPSSASPSPGETIQASPSGKPGLGSDQVSMPGGTSPSPGKPSTAANASSRGATASVPNASMRVMAEELKLLLQPTAVPRAERQAIQMEQAREGLRVSLMDDAARSMFRPGTAVLNPYARAMLEQIARKLAPSTLQLAIEGHTDGQGGQSGDNWRLSADRALAARAALVDGGLPPDRFSEIVARGSTQPVYPDQPLRAENRRITIVLLGDGSALPSDVSFRF